ncbi:MAG: dihydrolipoamide dehydrogenase, partial [Thermodesulfobacteriota bacterium]|nr:dihydrolipoamide dehydrogenase [Thermodesulfobacteriota bacterium]
MVVGDFPEGAQVVVIGGGPGGYVCAIRAAQLGMDVTLVERDLIGGVCLNWGCIPSKALAHVSDLKRKIERAESLGISVSDVRVDMSRVISWKDGIVDKLRNGVSVLLEKNRVRVVKGNARFTGTKSLVVEGGEGWKRFEFEHAVLATGSSPIQLPGMPFDGRFIIDSSTALGLRSIPERMVIVGAGAVGLEIGTYFAKFGTKVSILDASDVLLPSLDPQIGKTMEESVRTLGIDLLLGSRVLGIEPRGSLVHVDSAVEGKEQSFIANTVLVAIGRRPNTVGLGLEKIGLNPNPRGFVSVNERMETAVKGIYAIGDIVEGHMLAHRASFQGKVAAEVIAGLPSAYEGVEVPSVIFSDPEIAVVGLTEEEAQAQGMSVKVGVFPFRALGRALT